MYGTGVSSNRDNKTRVIRCFLCYWLKVIYMREAQFPLQMVSTADAGLERPLCPVVKIIFVELSELDTQTTCTLE
jgi:hypothetical protein